MKSKHLALLISSLLGPSAAAQNVAAFRMVLGEFTDGGGFSTSGKYSVQGSLRAGDGDSMRGGRYVLEGGLRGLVSGIPSTAPCALKCAGDLSIPCLDSTGAILIYPLPILEGVCSPGTHIVCDPPSGTRIGMGTTIVTCQAIDAQGLLRAECKFVASVVGDCLPLSRPVLQLMTDAGVLILRWNDPSAQLRLESASRLDSQIAWEPVSGDIVNSGQERTVAIPTSTAARFFRLRTLH